MAKIMHVVLTDTATGLPVKKFKAGVMRTEGHILKCFSSSYVDELVGFFLMTPGIIATREDIEED